MQPTIPDNTPPLEDLIKMQQAAELVAGAKEKLKKLGINNMCGIGVGFTASDGSTFMQTTADIPDDLKEALRLQLRQDHHGDQRH